MPSTFDIHQHITDIILAQLDQVTGEFELPWHRAGGLTQPTNVASRRPYQGVNVLALWAAGETNGYTSGLWGTYRQWNAARAQVRRGERASFVVFFKETSGGESAESHGSASSSSGAKARTGENTPDDRRGPRLIARASAVFAAEQVDDFSLPQSPQIESFETPQHVSAFVQATHAQIVQGGDRAFYRPSTDVIHIPPQSAFIGSAASSPEETFYSTLLHELVHWTSAKDRCDRELGNRFGDAAYAMEELVAEIGAAFLCADLGISSTPRPDHARYLASWLKVLCDDNRAIFTAASKASQAAAFLHALQPGMQDDAMACSGCIGTPYDLSCAWC